MSYFRSLAPVVVVLALAAIGGWWYMQQPTLVTAPALSASGTLEADETLVAPRVGGAITSLPVEPGQTVTAGQVRLKALLAEKRPEVGDTLTITHTGIEKRAGGKTLKLWTVEVVRGGGGGLSAVPDEPNAEQLAAMKLLGMSA